MKTLLNLLFILVQFNSYSQENCENGINDKGLDYSSPHYHEKYLLDKSNRTIHFISFYGDSILEDSSKVYIRHDKYWISDNIDGYKEVGRFQKYKVSFFKRRTFIKYYGETYVLMKKVGKWQYFDKDALIKLE
jgi:hypothetical protein